ncbi:50S ribosomal protein L5 [Candidatus Roizmanbacteria bacterium]|nr:MAG: 50S ribosomal protein L5 [Candidatus Roizmanbacteria bacterium]
MAGLKERYNKEIKPALKKEYKIENDFAVPTVLKTVVNVGAGEAVVNKKVIEKIQEQIEQITGQKTVVTKARKSISAYKIRKGLAIGVKVTLRGKKMYSFLEKLTAIVLPRLRDFRGIPESAVDQHGNLNLGFTEQTIFPEIEYDKVDKLRGLEVTVVTSTKNREQGKKLFELMGIPFSK